MDNYSEQGKSAAAVLVAQPRQNDTPNNEPYEECRSKVAKVSFWRANQVKRVDPIEQRRGVRVVLLENRDLLSSLDRTCTVRWVEFKLQIGTKIDVAAGVPFI